MGGSGGTGADVSFVEGVRQTETSTNDELCPNTGGSDEGGQGIVGAAGMGMQAGQGPSQPHGEGAPSVLRRAHQIVVANTASVNTGKGGRKGRRKGGGRVSRKGSADSFVAEELRRKGVVQGSVGSTKKRCSNQA